MDRVELERTLGLVKAAQGGDREALERLFERYLPAVRQIVALRMGRRLRELSDLEDLVQDALLRVFQSLGSFDTGSEGSFRNWIARAVENTVIDGVRSAQALKRGAGKLKRIDPGGSSALLGSALLGRVLEANGPSPSEGARAQELGERIEGALLELPRHYREVIVLRKLCEMSYAEIAAAMGFKEEVTARMAVSRGLAKLREMLPSN